MKMKIGVIGVGSVLANKVHLPFLTTFSEVDVKAICDIDPNQLKTADEKYRIRNTFTDYREMVKKEQLDCVYVIVPPDRTVGVIKDLIHLGIKHIFSEKPLGLSLREAEDVADLASQKNCVVMVGFNRIFMPVVRKTRDRLLQLKTRLSLIMAEKHGWVNNPQFPLLFENAIHPLSLLVWLGGKVKTVQKVKATHYRDFENIFNVIIEFENGSIGVLIANYSTGGWVEKLQIHNEKIGAYIDMPHQSTIIQTEGKVVDPATFWTVIENKAEIISNPIWASLPYRFGFEDEHRHFIDCVKRGAKPETSVENTLETVSLAQKISTP